MLRRQKKEHFQVVHVTSISTTSLWTIRNDQDSGLKNSSKTFATRGPTFSLQFKVWESARNVKTAENFFNCNFKIYHLEGLMGSELRKIRSGLIPSLLNIVVHTPPPSPPPTNQPWTTLNSIFAIRKPYLI